MTSYFKRGQIVVLTDEGRKHYPRMRWWKYVVHSSRGGYYLCVANSLEAKSGGASPRSLWRLATDEELKVIEKEAPPGPGCHGVGEPLMIQT